MLSREIARQILSAIGGKENIRSCGICATRLRILVNDKKAVDLDALESIHGVLGIVEKGSSGIEVVLGPRLVNGVSGRINELAGIRSSLGQLKGFEEPQRQGGISIQVSDAASPDTLPDDMEPASIDSASNDDETEALEGMLESINDDEPEITRSLLVINGPNINMLGIREPTIYGSESYEHLVELCEEAAQEAGFDTCECKQSNHEGDLVDYIQQAFGVHDAIVINPAAYTHTSVALLDALKAVQIPAVEVHISAVDEREEFRRISYVRDACIATIAGHGIEGYREAIKLLASHLDI